MAPSLKPTKVRGVYLRPDGAFFLRVTYVAPSGKREDLRRVLPAGTPLKKAEMEIAAMRLAVRAPPVPEPTPAPDLPTVAGYAIVWATRKAERGRWREGSNSRRAVETTVERMVLPDIGHLKVDEVTLRHLQAWLDSMLRRTHAGGKHYSANYIRQAWAYAADILEGAAAEYGFTAPRFDLVDLPKAGRKGGLDQALTPDQLHQVMATVREQYSEWWPVVLLGFASGARLSELMAAEVRDLELSGQVGVWRIVRHLGEDDTVVPGTKTGPERIAYIDPVSTELLREALKGAFGLASVAPVKRYQRERTPGRSPKREQIRKFFWVLSERAGIEMTLKVFRQTYTTLSRLAGVASVVVQEQVGHSSEQVQDIYTRLAPEMRMTAALQLAAILHR